MLLGEANDFSNQIWFPFKNTNAGQCPAFGIIRITDEEPLNGQLILQGEQPNTYGSQYSHYVNGPMPVETNKIGMCTNIGRYAALYDSADGTPAIGEIWGPRSGTWKLKKYTPGFRIVGNRVDTTNKVTTVHQYPFLRFRGIADGDITVNTVGDVSVWIRDTTTTFTDTGLSLSALNDLDDTVASGSVVECVIEEYLGVVGWRIIQSDFTC